VNRVTEQCEAIYGCDNVLNVPQFCVNQRCVTTDVEICIANYVACLFDVVTVVAFVVARSSLST
jgi:hypothetical protein